MNFLFQSFQKVEGLNSKLNKIVIIEFRLIIEDGGNLGFFKFIRKLE